MADSTVVIVSVVVCVVFVLLTVLVGGVWAYLCWGYCRTKRIADDEKATRKIQNANKRPYGLYQEKSSQRYSYSGISSLNAPLKPAPSSRNGPQEKIYFGSHSDVNMGLTESISNLIASSQATSVYKAEDKDELNLDEDLFEHNKMKVLDNVVVFESSSAADITEQELAELNNILDNHDRFSEAESDRNEPQKEAAASSLTTTPTMSRSSLEVTSGSESEGEGDRPLKRRRRPSYVFAAGMINPTKDQVKQARQPPPVIIVEEASEEEVHAPAHESTSSESREESSEVEKASVSDDEARSNNEESQFVEEEEEEAMAEEEVLEEEERIAALKQQLAQMEELERKMQEKYGEQGSEDGGESVNSAALSSQVSEDEFDQDDLITSLSHVARVRKQFQGNKSPPTKARSMTRSTGCYSPNASLSSLEEETFFDQDELQDALEDEDLGASMPNIDLSEPPVTKPATALVSPLAKVTHKASTNTQDDDASSSDDDGDLPLAVKGTVPVHHAKIQRSNTQEELELLGDSDEEDLQLPLAPTTDSQHIAKRETAPILDQPRNSGNHSDEDEDERILPLAYEHITPAPTTSKKRKATPGVGGGISDHARYKLIRQQQLKTDSIATVPSPPLHLGSLSNSRSQLEHMDMIAEED